MFTKEQIDEIGKRLAQKGTRDTDFPEVTFPLSGEETVAVVQDGENRQLPIKEINDYKKVVERMDSLESDYEDFKRDTEEKMDEYIVNSLKFVDQGDTASLDGNMNALLDPGIYKQCYLGRPVGSTDGEYYTLETLDGEYASDSGTSTSAAMLEILSRVTAWCRKVSEKPEVDVMHNLSQLEELLSKTGTYNYMNYLYPEKYSTETGTQTFTSFVKRVPKGKYTIKVTVWSSSTGNRDSLPLPTALPDIVVTSGGVSHSLTPSSANVADYIRTQLDVAASCEATLTLDTQETAEGDVLSFSLDSRTTGYNWFVYTFSITNVQGLAWDEYKIIPQMCISHKTSDIYKRVLYSCEADLPVEQRRFEPPFTLYPEYTSYDDQYEEVTSGWDRVVNAVSFINILGSYDEGVNERFVTGNRVPVVNIAADRATITTELINGNGQTVSTIPIRLGSATTELAGLLSAMDKQHLDTAYDVLGTSESAQGVIDKFNEVKEFLEGITVDETLISLLNGLTPISYSGNDKTKQNGVQKTTNNTNVVTQYSQNGLVFGEDNEILVHDINNTNYYPANALIEGTENKSDAKSSHVEGRLNSAVWDVNGAMRRANYGEALITKYNLTDDAEFGADCAHAEGYRNVASGWISHAEGNKNVAAGRNAHAEGHGTLAAGSTSHAEGRNTIARGSYSHAQGNATEANGASSFAAGKGTIATSEAETALGQYNEPNHLFSVGIGTDENHRKNAIEINSDGSIGFYHPETDGHIYFSDMVSYMLTDVLFTNLSGSLICQLGKGDNTTVNRTVPIATTANDGAMSRTDKRNLDNIVGKLDALIGGISDSLAGYKVECVPTNPLVFKGTNANTQTFNVRYGNNLIEVISASATSGADTLVVQPGTTCAISTSLSLASDIVLNGVAKIRNTFEVPFTSTIKVVDKIHYGFTSNPTIFIGGGGLVKPATTVYKDTYSDTSTGNADYFFILLPTTIVNEDITQICQFTMGGAPVAMVKDSVTTIDNATYNVYRTAASYTSGTTLNITIS